MTWLLIVFTAVVFLASTLPSQRKQLLEEMRQRAQVAFTSTSQVAIESIILEDYSGIVEHCLSMVSQNPSLKYVVLTREDGFSLIHSTSLWKQEKLDGMWKPADMNDGGEGRILEHKLTEGKVFHVTFPLRYSGIFWGWIHLGLSPEKFFKDLRQLYTRTSIVAMVAILGGLLASFLYARRLSVPLQRLDQFATQIAEGDLSQRIEIQTGDEVQSLAESFNHMVTELNNSNQKLVETARKAGMAEMAADVIHNVGNVLNSIGITTQNLKRRVQKNKMTAIAPLAELLESKHDNLAEFLANDPKGKKIPEYLRMLGDHFAEDCKTIGSGLDDLERHIQHIQEIVRLQQRYSRTVGVTEQITITDVIEDAIAFNANEIRKIGIEVVRSFENVPQVLVDRQRLLQVVTNLISNARQALSLYNSAEKKIEIRTQTIDAELLVVSVADNGIGIPEENFTRIFQHGFTTRKDGHGFGLHSSALAASEMGGSLTVESLGTGQGAKFELTLPLRLAEMKHG